MGGAEMSALPQPRARMSVEEFLDSLDQNNAAIAYVRGVFTRCSGNIMEIYRKDRDLTDLVRGRYSQFRLPVIDKLLRIVIELRDDHEDITGALFCYHAAGKGEDYTIYDERIYGEMYGRGGYGYYFSGARWPQTQVVLDEFTYKPDVFDKDLMIFYRIKHA